MSTSRLASAGCSATLPLWPGSITTTRPPAVATAGAAVDAVEGGGAAVVVVAGAVVVVGASVVVVATVVGAAVDVLVGRATVVPLVERGAVACELPPRHAPAQQRLATTATSGSTLTP